MRKSKDNLLKKLMRMRNVSQYSLAKRLGMSAQQMNKRVNRRIFRNDELPVLSKLLGVPEGELLEILKENNKTFLKIINR